MDPQYQRSMETEIAWILLSASLDGKIQPRAEERLKHFREQNFIQFLLFLSGELSNTERPFNSQLAGVILQDCLDTEKHFSEELIQQWINADMLIKDQIKKSLLQTLQSSLSEAMNISAQIIPKVASIEIPRGEWNDLISRLLQNIKDPLLFREKALMIETLGNVCGEISQGHLEQQEVNDILSDLCPCTQQRHGSKFHLLAIRSLHTALELTQPDFENYVERDDIIKDVCTTARSKVLEIRREAFKCLVSISSKHYSILQPHMQRLSDLMADAMKQDRQAVALQALEFWKCICDKEIQLQGGNEGADQHRHFIIQALPSLVPTLLETLLKQEENLGQDDEALHLSAAGGNCLSLVSRVVGDEIEPCVTPFVVGNISNPDRRSREAATIAFRSILEGPSPEMLLSMINTVLELLLNAMTDQDSHVKVTTAETLSRIFVILHSPRSPHPIITDDNLPQLKSTLLESIRAIHILAWAYKDAASDSSLLTPYLGEIIAGLLSTANNLNLQASAYDTLNEIVRCSKFPETENMIIQLLTNIVDRLSHTVEIHLQAISSDRIERRCSRLTLLCGVLHLIIEKLIGYCGTKHIVAQHADEVMSLLLKVFSSQSHKVNEDAMLSVGHLVNAVGSDFAKHMPEFCNYLCLGLRNFEKARACFISAAVASKICLKLHHRLLFHCHDIMSNLFTSLSGPNLHHLVKLPIFECFGKIALLTEGLFELYFDEVMLVLQQDADLCATLSDAAEDMLRYGRQLRRCIFQTYIDILVGFGFFKPEKILPCAEHMLQFIEDVFMDTDMVHGLICRDEETAKRAVFLMGILAEAIGTEAQIFFQQRPFHNDLVGLCLQSNNQQLRNVAGQVLGVIEKIMNQ